VASGASAGSGRPPSASQQQPISQQQPSSQPLGSPSQPQHSQKQARTDGRTLASQSQRYDVGGAAGVLDMHPSWLLFNPADLAAFSDWLLDRDASVHSLRIPIFDFRAVLRGHVCCMQQRIGSCLQQAQSIRPKPRPRFVRDEAEAGICALQVLKHVQFFMQDASSDEEEKKAQPAVDDSIPERQRHRVVRGRGRGRLPFGGLGRGGR